MADFDPATRLRAEALALAACRELAAEASSCAPPTPTRVVWRTGERDAAHVALRESGGYADGVMLYADGTCEWSDEYGAMADLDVPSAKALWARGFALHEITADAVTILAPIGGVL